MKKFETRLRIIMTLEKLEGRRNLMGKAWQPIDPVEPPRPPVKTESEAKEVCWYIRRSLACPSTSKTLFSGLLVSTHGKQVASLLARFLLTAQGMGASGLFVCLFSICLLILFILSFSTSHRVICLFNMTLYHTLLNMDASKAEKNPLLQNL